MWLLFALLVKHAIADLALQHSIAGGHPKDQWFGKAHLHYWHHGALTFIIMLLWPNIHVGWAFALAAFDYVVHWHIDYWKHCIQNWYNVKHPDDAYWWFAAIDQILHFATYFIIVSVAWYWILQ